MRPIDSLRPQLKALDGKDYGAYQSLLGPYRHGAFDLLIDQIPKDPYAPPHTGVYRVRVPREEAGFPSCVLLPGIPGIAFRDFLTRRILEKCREFSKRRGTGNSGIVTISEARQGILRRTSVVFDETHIEARVFLGLPASGRKIRAELAERMIFRELPEVVSGSMFADSLEADAILRHLQAAEDAEFLRALLPSRGLVAFIADGAVLPRASGVDPCPLDTEQAVPIRAPEGLRQTVELPNSGPIAGLGIPEGVTLIVGGGYHGKSTLLNALEEGIYNHIPGDGRELSVSLPDTVKVRAYSGRQVVNTDVSMFIRGIPKGQDTRAFTSGNASGSTSQAAFISEVLEVGATVLLMDEDTCATNFLIRDRRMQDLVKKEQEPITAFIDKVRQLYEEHGISTVLVLGGSGDYLEVADQVIQLVDFSPRDVTDRAREVVLKTPSERADEGMDRFELPRDRYPSVAGLEPRNDHGHRRVYAPNSQELVYGRMKVDLNDVEQLLEPAQTKAIGLAIEHGRKYMDGKTTLREVVARVLADVDEHGLDLLDPRFTGDLAEFRGLELAATLNRMREFSAVQEPFGPGDDGG